MAVVCASSSVGFATSSSSSCSTKSFFFLNKTSAVAGRRSPFLGFSVAFSKPKVPTTFSADNRKSFLIKCQDQDLSLVPENQRWMFEEDEADGPVIVRFPSLLSSVFLYLFIAVCLLRKCGVLMKNLVVYLNISFTRKMWGSISFLYQRKKEKNKS